MIFEEKCIISIRLDVIFIASSDVSGPLAVVKGWLTLIDGQRNAGSITVLQYVAQG